MTHGYDSFFSHHDIHAPEGGETKLAEETILRSLGSTGLLGITPSEVPLSLSPPSDHSVTWGGHTAFIWRGVVSVFVCVSEPSTCAYSYSPNIPAGQEEIQWVPLRYSNKLLPGNYFIMLRVLEGVVTMRRRS